MSRESNTFNLSNSDIFDVMRSVFGANTIPRYEDTDSSVRNVSYSGVPQSSYNVLQNSEMNSANQMYDGNRINLQSLLDGRNISSLFPEKNFNAGAYNVSDSSALEALQELRSSASSSSQSALRQDWNQEYLQNDQLKELYNLDRCSTSQTLSDSPKNIATRSLLSQIFDNESSFTSSDAASCKPFNDLNLKTVDEEDEFLYGDSNSLPEIPKSVKDDPVDDQKIVLGTGWSDDEDPYNDLADDMTKSSSEPTHSVWDARNRGSEITQPSVSLLHDKLSNIKRDKKALPKTSKEQFLPPVVKEPFVASAIKSEEPKQKLSPDSSAEIKTEKKSKYQLAAEILKKQILEKQILEKTRKMTKSSSNERINDVAGTHRKMLESDSRITTKSSKIIDSNKPDIKSDKLPVNQQRHLPKAFVQKDLEGTKSHIKGSSGKRIHPGEELEQESKYLRYESARKISPPRHYPPQEIIRHDYKHSSSAHIRPRSPNMDHKKYPSPHHSLEHERKLHEIAERKLHEIARYQASRYHSHEKHRQYSHSPDRERGSHDKSPGYYRHRMRSPGSHRSKRSRSPQSYNSREKSRSPRMRRSRERSRSPRKHKSREKSRSPRIRRSREKSRSPRLHKPRERSKSPRKHISQERKLSGKEKSFDKTKKSVPAPKKKPLKKKKSRDDSSSSSSFCSISFDSVSSSSSDSSSESSDRREKTTRKKEPLKTAIPNKSKIIEDSTKGLDVTVKSSDAAIPSEDSSKRISDNFSSSKEISTNSSTSDAEKIKMIYGLIDDAKKHQYLQEIFNSMTQNQSTSSTVQEYTFPAAVHTDVTTHHDSPVPVLPSSEPYEPYPPTTAPPAPYPPPEPSQVNYPDIPITSTASRYPYPQHTYGIQNVVNIVPRSTDFSERIPFRLKDSTDNLHPVKTKAPQMRQPTLRQIEVKNDFSSEDTGTEFKPLKSVTDKSVKTLPHKISKESFEKKIQEIKEKQYMKGAYSETTPPVESKDDKTYYIEKYKKLEADRQLKQQITKNCSNDVAQMLKIMNNTFGKKIGASEKLIHSKCKNLFNYSRDVFNNSIKETKQADENLKKFKSEIPPELEKEVLGVKVDLTEEEASEEFFTCYDSGDHICFLCNSEKFRAISNMMEHIQSVEHKALAAVSDNGWKSYFMKDKNKKDKETTNKKCTLTAVKGIEFIKPLTGFFCDLCKEVILDSESVEQHVKSHNHFSNFKSFMKKNPLYERKRLLKRYIQITTAPAKIKRVKEMEEKKQLVEEKRKREEEANEKAQEIIKKEKSREIKIEELEEGSEVISVSNSPSSANIKVNLSSPEKKAQKESETKKEAKYVFIGKAPNFKKAQNQISTTITKTIPWYKRESILKNDTVKGNSSETEEKPLKSEKEPLLQNKGDSNKDALSQSKDSEREQKQKVPNESATSKNEVKKDSCSGSSDSKLSKSKSDHSGSQSASKGFSIHGQQFSVCQDIPLPEMKPSKPRDPRLKVEEKSVPMEIDNSQDTGVKPGLASEEEKDFMILGIHKDDFKPLVIPVPPPTQVIPYSSSGGTQTCLPNLNFSVPPPSVVPHDNRPPMSVSYPINQSNTQSVGLYSYPSNDPSRSMYSNQCNMQAVPSFNVPPPSFRNPPPMNAYPNSSNMAYANQQQFPPPSMSPMQTFSNTNRFSMLPPPVPGSGPPAYSPLSSNPPSYLPLNSNRPLYPAQNSGPTLLPTQSPSVSQTFVPASGVVCNASFTKTSPTSPNVIQTTAVSPLQNLSPGFKNHKLKANLIEIVPTNKETLLPFGKNEKIGESNTKSVKQKEISENIPVSHTSDDSKTQTKSDDVANIKKDSNEKHGKKIKLNLKKLDNKNEKNSVTIKNTSDVTNIQTKTDDRKNDRSKDSSGKNEKVMLVNIEEADNKGEKNSVGDTVRNASDVTNIKSKKDDSKNAKDSSEKNRKIILINLEESDSKVEQNNASDIVGNASDVTNIQSKIDDKKSIKKDFEKNEKISLINLEESDSKDENKSVKNEKISLINLEESDSKDENKSVKNEKISLINLEESDSKDEKKSVSVIAENSVESEKFVEQVSEKLTENPSKSENLDKSDKKNVSMTVRCLRSRNVHTKKQNSNKNSEESDSKDEKNSVSIIAENSEVSSENIVEQVSEKHSENSSKSEKLNKSGKSNVSMTIRRLRGRNIPTKKQNLNKNSEELEIKDEKNSVSIVEENSEENSEIFNEQDSKNLSESPSKSENLDKSEKRNVSMAVKRLRGRNIYTKKQIFNKNTRQSRVQSVQKIISKKPKICAGAKFKKPFSPDEPVAGNMTSTTEEDSKTKENISKISNSSQGMLTDRNKTGDEELRLNNPVKDSKSSKIDDSTSSSKDYESNLDETGDQLPSGNSPSHSDQTKEFFVIMDDEESSKSGDIQFIDNQSDSNSMPKLEKMESSIVNTDVSLSSEKQASTSSNNFKANESHSNNNKGKDVIRKLEKSQQKESNVLSSFLENVVDVKEEYNKIKSVEKFKISLEVSKFYGELGHSTDMDDKTSSSEKQTSADLENIQEETENIASQAQISVEDTLKETESMNIEKKSELHSFSSSEHEPMTIEEGLKKGSLPLSGIESKPTEMSSEDLNMSDGNEILPDIKTETSVLAEPETSELISLPSNAKSEIKQPKDEDLPEASENVSETFNLPSTENQSGDVMMTEVDSWAESGSSKQDSDTDEYEETQEA